MIIGRLMRTGFVAAVVAAGALVVAPHGAQAQVDPGGTGCSGSATFKAGLDGKGLTIDPATAKGTIVVPRKDDVAWQGSVTDPPGTYHGEVTIDLPAPFGTITVDDWQGTSQRTSNAGTKHYDLPSWVPAGATVRVIGTHTDANGTCTGWVDLKIDGKPIESPTVLVGAGAGLLTALGFAKLVKPLFTKV